MNYIAADADRLEIAAKNNRKIAVADTPAERADDSDNFADCFDKPARFDASAVSDEYEYCPQS